MEAQRGQKCIYPVASPSSDKDPGSEGNGFGFRFSPVKSGHGSKQQLLLCTSAEVAFLKLFGISALYLFCYFHTP